MIFNPSRTVHAAACLVLASSGLSACEDSREPAVPYEAASVWVDELGPGLGDGANNPEDLFEICHFVDLKALNPSEHYNLVAWLNGYMLVPASPEFGTGSLSFWDMADPCDPEMVGATSSDLMRETHAIGFTRLGDRWITSTAWAAGALPSFYDDELRNPGGALLWDVSDPTDPQTISRVEVPTHMYPDAYARVVLSTFMRGTTVFIGQTDGGVHSVDISDPENPVLLDSYQLEPILRVGMVQAVGDLLFVTGAETPDTAILDVSDPANMRLIDGGRFQTTDEEGDVRAFYFSNLVGGYIYYARKESGGGLMIYDVRDPYNPVKVGAQRSDGNGGYVFGHEDYAFVGESNFAAVYDVADPANIEEVGRVHLEGDLDTLTPIGQFAVVSVDADAEDGRGIGIAQWAEDPDRNAPVAAWSWPLDGAEDMSPQGTLGISFNEMIEPASAFSGSVRLFETERNAERTRVDLVLSVQDSILNAQPMQPLEPDTEYTLLLPAGGIADISGNALTEDWQITFTTSSEPAAEMP